MGEGESPPHSTERPKDLMDPLTAGLGVANVLVQLWMKVWDATPEAERTVVAKDLAQALHSILKFVQDLQGAQGRPRP